MIFHIADAELWQAASATGEYLPAAFGAEGFIHCSESHQVAFVADLLFREREGLVLLEVDEARLSAEVRRENLEGGEWLFPHIYGPIPLAAVVRVDAIPPGEDGRLELPESLGRFRDTSP